jgi:hypothetical protein
VLEKYRSLSRIKISIADPNFGKFYLHACSSLLEFKVLNTIPSLTSNVFADYNTPFSLTIPDSMIKLRRLYFHKCPSLPTIVIAISVILFRSKILQDVVTG